MEAPPRFELGIKVLQTTALPLGYSATYGGSNWNRTSDTRIFSPLLYRLSYRAILPRNFLLSHTVSHAVPSAVIGLTILFGMGRGVTQKHIITRLLKELFVLSKLHISFITFLNWSSPRPISISQLNMLPHLHL